MSIAIANTDSRIGVRTPMAGPRQLRTISRDPRDMRGYMILSGTLGAVDPETISVLQAQGYDSGTLNTLIALGATDDQLQSLPYGPGTTADDMSSGVTGLMQALTGGPPYAGIPAAQMQTSAVGYLYSPLATTGQVLATANPVTAAIPAQAAAQAAGQSLMQTLFPGIQVTPQGQVTALPGSAPGAAAAPAPTTFQGFLSEYGVWILLIAGAAIVLPPLIKKL
jgi:hypothetical protein